MKPFFLFVILFFLSNQTIANVCENTIKGVSICEVSKGVALAIAKNAPQRVSQNIVLNGAYSFNNKIIVTSIFSHTKQSFESHVKSIGASTEAINDGMRLMTKNSLCSDPRYLPLIEAGIIFVYWYKYSDGVTYLEIEVDSCS
ncbi:hypothetical protein A3740_15860 [Oleiphilus sp. HI0068]|nr:hypothetical protein A3740_15860 [Oleiphilus sp. HI0068]KZY83930.1 hypothetical protein A3741_16485 [Oleiphilus sp. HI0069]KZY83943.1 hypothetical protein A3741_30710 [Oleiphilus sp. HI0069]KZZ30745.1 hypothetical protein A3755_13310 [Oleiphilus sp. HI0085]KZZ74598.1 hypothetical protein A3766_18335 [Oleiphilus sp. HI0132]